MSGEREVEVVTTRNGARAVRDRVTGEVMHPVIGPRAEAEALYVAASRLSTRLTNPEEGSAPLVLFDVGLGAGSNALAAWAASERAPLVARRLEIVSFDRTTAALELALDRANAADFGVEGPAGEAARTLLARGAWESGRTSWRLVVAELPAALEREAPESADIVFWDPFSPRANPELWCAAAFAALRRVCHRGATVHTYSCATAVRSALLLAGFVVGIGEGTGEKQDTTVAGVPPAAVPRALDRRWLERLARSSAPFPRDAPPDAMARIAAHPQFAR